MSKSLLRGDQVRLKDGRIVDVVSVWGVARCHAFVRGENGATFPIIAERDVDAILRRTAIQKSKWRDN